MKSSGRHIIVRSWRIIMMVNNIVIIIIGVRNRSRTRIIVRAQFGMLTRKILSGSGSCRDNDIDTDGVHDRAIDKASAIYLGNTIRVLNIIWYY